MPAQRRSKPLIESRRSEYSLRTVDRNVIPINCSAGHRYWGIKNALSAPIKELAYVLEECAAVSQADTPSVQCPKKQKDFHADQA
jgi:hypothetical protein